MGDQSEVYKVVRSAFSEMDKSSGTEHLIVERLRNSDAFDPRLSLVADFDGKIIGHILLSKVFIESDDHKIEALSLAPVSVLKEYQNQGVGSGLIMKSHKIAIEHGYKSVLLVGHADYYPKFGYQRADIFGIKFPFDSAPENCMVIELKKGSLKGVKGTVRYPREFFA